MRSITGIKRWASAAPSALSLKGGAVGPVVETNLKALKARPCIAPDWTPRFIKAQSPLLREMRAEHRFFGEVRVDVTGAPPLVMLNHDDDLVACIYFFFGKDAYESLSVHLFAKFSEGAEAVLDVGAFTGLFGLLAAKIAPEAHVASFEPTPHIVERARLNGVLNGLDNYFVVGEAVSDAAGEAVLTLYGGGAATTGASLASKPRSDIGSITVDTTTIDDYVAGLGGRRVSLIKLDTEGAELSAIAGAAATLRHHGPVVLSEVLSDDALAAQADAMAPYGYTPHFINDKWRRIVAIGPKFTLSNRGGYGNVIFTRTKSDLQRARRTAEAFQALAIGEGPW